MMHSGPGLGQLMGVMIVYWMYKLFTASCMYIFFPSVHVLKSQHLVSFHFYSLILKKEQVPPTFFGLDKDRAA